MNQLKTVVCFFVLCLLMTDAVAQQGNSCPEDLFPYYDKEKRTWGYADMMGMPVVEPIFTKVSPFSNNCGVVQKGNLCGVIDCNGNLIIPVQYEKMLSFRFNKVWAMKEGKWCLLDTKGRMVLTPQFEEIYPITNTELVWVKKEKLWGLFNDDKVQYICNPKFTVAQVMSPQCSLIQINGKLGVLNHVNCGYLLEPTIENVKKITVRDIIFNQDGKWGIFNNAGKTTLNPMYDSLDVIKENVLIAKLNGKYGLLSTGGSVLLPVEYDAIYPYSNVFFRIKKDGKYGYASVMGKVFIKPVYTDAQDFHNGYAIVQSKGLYGMINFTDSMMVPPVYTSIILSDTKEYYIAQKNAQQATIITTLNNAVSVSDVWSNVAAEDSAGFVRVMKDGRVYFYNTVQRRYSIDKGFEQAEALKGGKAIIREQNAFGIIKRDGSYLIPVEYDSIKEVSLYKSPFYIIQKGGLKGLLDANGKSILPPVYQSIVMTKSGLMKLQKDNLWSLARLNGTVISSEFYNSMSMEDVFPVPVQRSGKWCLLNEKGEETKLIKAKSIIYTGKGMYTIDYGKKKAFMKGTGEIVPVAP